MLQTNSFASKVLSAGASLVVKLPPGQVYIIIAIKKKQ